MKKTHRSTFFYVNFCVLGLIFLLSACSSQFATRGNLPDDVRLGDVIVGETHARDVADILGTPTSFSTFGGETWYYISERVETFIFFEPEIIERVVVAIEFDKTALVKSINRDNNAQIRRVAFVDRRTPTAGNEISFFEQIFGNLGRFNPEAQ